jgi:murein tripeptide amidase MpaA
MDGIMKYFCQSNYVTDLLLKNITIKIIPMMNPDGVFIGNYRMGIMGADFNRKFDS